MSGSNRKTLWRTTSGSTLATFIFSTTMLLPTPAATALIPPAVPELEEGAGIIKNKQAAIALGKALFWDKQAGSDGMACASCHFSAGADNRVRNQLSPGFNDASFPNGGDEHFGSTHSDTGAVLPGEMPSVNPAGSNYTLLKEDFPLHQPTDYKDRNSPLRTTTNDVVSSSGAYGTEFNRVRVLGRPDKCTKADGSIFHAGMYPARQVEPRNTPTTINAAFFHSNFWDGRAKNVFNGVGVFGMRDIAGDPNKRLIVMDSSNMPQLGYLQIPNASLASQAVGPPLSALEMSCEGRNFPDVGRKLLLTIPLRTQKVSMTDSVLGPYVSASGKGLKHQHSYAALIKQAFEPKYWAAPGRFKIVNGQLNKAPLLGYTQMETNFSMFWGLSIMLYEQSLISDQSRFDTWFASCRPAATNPSGTTVPVGNPVVTCLPEAGNPNQSTDPTAHGFTAQEVLGFGLFNNAGTGIRNAGNPSCAGCHGPIANPRAATGVVFPVLSEAAFQNGQSFVPVERSLIVDLGDGIPLLSLPPLPQLTTDQRAGAVHDRGFFNIGVTPTHVDQGNGGTDPYGTPLSIGRIFQAELAGTTAVDPSGITNRCNTLTLIEPGGTPIYPGCVLPITDTANLNPPPLSVSEAANLRDLVDGGFKTPSLRNVGLTPPYFHSGNYADLRSVVEFYARGGSRRSKSIEHASFTGDTSGTGPLGKDGLLPPGPDFGTNVDFFIRDIRSTDEQIDALVAFMLTLSDERVQCDKEPFDHPELTIFHGHTTMDKNPKDGKADDIKVTLPAVGAAGFSMNSGYCVPNGGDLFAPGMQGRVGGAKVPL